MWGDFDFVHIKGKPISMSSTKTLTVGKNKANQIWCIFPKEFYKPFMSPRRLQSGVKKSGELLRLIN